MNVNIIKKSIINVIIAIILIVLFWSIPWILFGIAGQLSPNPPTPQTKYGEFPFSLVYEIDGEIIEAKDVLICEFDGFGFSEGSGEKYRKWKSHFKSGNTRITLLRADEIEIFFGPGAAAFYMGDPDYVFENPTIFPDASYTRDFDNQTVNAYIISADEMWEKYKIRLISWEAAEPIRNIFK